MAVEIRSGVWGPLEQWMLIDACAQELPKSFGVAKWMHNQFRSRPIAPTCALLFSTRGSPTFQSVITHVYANDCRNPRQLSRRTRECCPIYSSDAARSTSRRRVSVSDLHIWSNAGRVWSAVAQWRLERHSGLSILPGYRTNVVLRSPYNRFLQSG